MRHVKWERWAYVTATTLKERFLWCGQRRTDELLILPPDFRKSPADRTCHPKRHRRQHTCAKFDSRRNFTRLILACAWHTARRVDNATTCHPCTPRIGLDMRTVYSEIPHKLLCMPMLPERTGHSLPSRCICDVQRSICPCEVCHILGLHHISVYRPAAPNTL